MANEFKVKHGIIVKNKTLFDTDSITTVSTTPTILSSFPSSLYISGKYVIQATQGSVRQVTELLLVHNETTVYGTEYGTILTDPNNQLFSVDVAINSGNVQVIVTSTSATSTDFITSFTLIGV